MTIENKRTLAPPSLYSKYLKQNTLKKIQRLLKIVNAAGFALPIALLVMAFIAIVEFLFIKHIPRGLAITIFIALVLMIIMEYTERYLMKRWHKLMEKRFENHKMRNI